MVDFVCHKFEGKDTFVKEFVEYLHTNVIFKIYFIPNYSHAIFFSMNTLKICFMCMMYFINRVASISGVSIKGEPF